MSVDQSKMSDNATMLTYLINKVQELERELKAEQEVRRTLELEAANPSVLDRSSNPLSNIQVVAKPAELSTDIKAKINNAVDLLLQYGKAVNIS